MHAWKGNATFWCADFLLNQEVQSEQINSIFLVSGTANFITYTQQIHQKHIMRSLLSLIDQYCANGNQNKER